MSGLIRLVLLGAVSAVVGGAFVVVKNRQHSLANEKASIEGEIVAINKRIETLDLRIAAMVDRDAIAARLDDLGGELVKIERAERVMASGQVLEQFASYRRPRSERDEF